MFHYLTPTQFVIGLFFISTGFRKLFIPAVHAQVFGMFDRLHVPMPARWLVVAGEFAGGLGLAFGVLPFWAGLGLLPIMAGAYWMSTLPEIRAKNPTGITGWTSKLLCNPEALLILLLLDIVLS